METKYEKKNQISDFKLRGVSEFCKVSHESLLLTGIPVYVI